MPGKKDFASVKENGHRFCKGKWASLPGAEKIDTGRYKSATNCLKINSQMREWGSQNLLN